MTSSSASDRYNVGHALMTCNSWVHVFGIGLRRINIDRSPSLCVRIPVCSRFAGRPLMGPLHDGGWVPVSDDASAILDTLGYDDAAGMIVALEGMDFLESDERDDVWRMMCDRTRFFHPDMVDVPKSGFKSMVHPTAFERYVDRRYNGSSAARPTRPFDCTSAKRQALVRGMRTSLIKRFVGAADAIARAEGQAATFDIVDAMSGPGEPPAGTQWKGDRWPLFITLYGLQTLSRMAHDERWTLWCAFRDDPGGHKWDWPCLSLINCQFSELNKWAHSLA